MEQRDILKQIKKFNNRRLKTRLAYFSTIITTFISFSSFGQGLTTSSLISFLVLLPIPAYFVLQSIKLFNKNNYLKTQSTKLLYEISLRKHNFSLLKFVTQPNPTFRLSLILLILIFVTAIGRIRTEEKTLSFNLEPQLLHQSQ